MDDLPGSIAALQQAYRRRQLSPVEVTRALLERAQRLQPLLRAFITVTPEQALAQAHAAERRLRDGETSPLLGAPLTLKDVYDQRGVPTTAGSGLRRTAVATADAPLVRRLFRAGAISLGKTNLDELAYSGTGSNLHFGAVRNPWDLARRPGGSSAGAGAAVASGLGLVGMGSDTVGSIRVPAALCGVVGLKPTYGRVPTAGMVPLYASLDHAGPLSRTVADAAAVLQVVAGGSRADPRASSRARGDYVGALGAGIAEMRVGLVALPRTEVDGEVSAAVDAAVATLEQLGARVLPVTWPALPPVEGLSAEAAVTHRELLETNPDGLGPYVRRRLEQGMAVRAVTYLASQRTLRELRRQTGRLFRATTGEPVDVLLGPTLPRAATLLDGSDGAGGGWTRFTRPYNETGLPAITVPCGFTSRGLPIGLQVAGRPFAETDVLRVAHAYEQATDWHRRRPPLACASPA
jgi:aspartyl-tRNA(Asn)/glutamyl-tRNA(Gln) amidotransferase subunit A